MAFSRQRLALLIAILILSLTVRRLVLARKSLRLSGVPKILKRTHIEGRWKDTRLSLRLLPLPDEVTIHLQIVPHQIDTITRLSRFELPRKRSANYSPASQLYFAPEAIHEPHTSLIEMARTFRAVVLAEKEADDGARKARTSERIERKRQK